MNAAEVRINEDSSVIVYTNRHESTHFSAGQSTSSTINIGLKKSTIGKRFKFANWFDDSANLETEGILNTLLANNIAPAILDTKAKFIVGSGLRCYKKNIIEGKKSIELMDIPEIDDWIERSNIFETMSNAELDKQFFGNAFFEFIMNEGKTVETVSQLDATTVRAEEKNAKDGLIYNYYVSGNWQKPNYNPDDPKKSNVVRVNGYVPQGSGQEKILWITNKLYPKFIYHARDYTPGFPYYGLPSWYGSLKWIELANTIPSWHLSGIRNGYAVRYLVEVSEAYFAKFTDDTLKAQAKQKLQDELDACLSGVENVGKTVYTVMPHQYYQEKGIIKITPIETDLHDEAFSILFQHSNTATTSGFQIDPTLCGIETQGKLSSGSEKRIAYELWLRLHAARPRQKLIKVMDIVKQINGWDKKYEGLQFGFENIDLTTLDVNPTGVQSGIIA